MIEQKNTYEPHGQAKEVLVAKEMQEVIKQASKL